MKKIQLDVKGRSVESRGSYCITRGRFLPWEKRTESWSLYVAQRRAQGLPLVDVTLVEGQKPHVEIDMHEGGTKPLRLTEPAQQKVRELLDQHCNSKSSRSVGAPTFAGASICYGSCRSLNAAVALAQSLGELPQNYFKLQA